MIKPENQVVKVGRVSEPERGNRARAAQVSWLTILTAQVSVEDMPEAELPVVQMAIRNFLQRLAQNAPKMVKGGLLEEFGIDLKDLEDLIGFLQQQRIEITGVEIREGGE